jgi:hypothetical protein
VTSTFHICQLTQNNLWTRICFVCLNVFDIVLIVVSTNMALSNPYGCYFFVQNASHAGSRALRPWLDSLCLKVRPQHKKEIDVL